MVYSVYQLIQKMNRKLNSIQRKLVEENVGLANSRALYYLHKYKNAAITLDIDDFKSYAFEGLCEAASRFDKSRNLRFSTYAVSYIDNYIKTYVYQENSTIKVPRYDKDEATRKHYRYIALNNAMVTSYESEIKSNKDNDIINISIISTEDGFTKVDNSDLVKYIKSKLNAKEQVLLELLSIDGITYPQIAKKIGMHQNSITRKKKELFKKIRNLNIQ